jgi:hypothetical protein
MGRKLGGRMYIDHDDAGWDEADFLAVCGFALMGLLVSLKVLLVFPAMPEMMALPLM